MSTAKPLLRRQVKLLEYLTSANAIFRDERNVPLALQGIDRRLLHLEARFSHEKRMEKIFAVFPRTFDLLGIGCDSIVRAFTETCPPVDIARLANARQFHGFLSTHWRQEPPMTPYLPDVAACELALATARVSEEKRTPRCVQGAEGTAQGHIRRRHGVVLLRAHYDIRPIFEHAHEAAVPMERDTRLAIVDSSVGDQPSISELAPAVFDLLFALDDWIDRTAFDELPEADGLISALAEANLLEIRR
jgi:hypothetical protein